MNKKKCHSIMIIILITILVFCFHPGAFAGKKDQHCVSYNEGLNELATYYQMSPVSSSR
jgi:hypothetical protein